MRFIAVLIVLFSLCAPIVEAGCYTKGGVSFSYRTEGKRVIITRWERNSRHVEIPAAINRMPVTAVEPGAFSRCKRTVSIAIPKSIIRMDANALKGCGKLSYLYFFGNPIPQGASWKLPDSVQGLYLEKNGKTWEKVIRNGEWKGLKMGKFPLYDRSLESTPPNEKLTLVPKDISRFATRRIIYKEVEGEDLHMTALFPPGWKADDQRGAILFFFGGGWVTGSYKQFTPQALELAQRGMVAFLVNYRTKNSHKTSPKECVSDARSAIRYVRKHAAELGINPNLIAAGGGSAGGHLSAAAACFSAFDDPREDPAISARPDAVFLYNGVVDNGPDGGWGYSKIKSYYRSISPAHNVKPGLPPTLFMLGTRDELIPISTALRYQARMRAAGNRCDLILYPGGFHGFFNPGVSCSFYPETLSASIRFLREFHFIK